MNKNISSSGCVLFLTGFGTLLSFVISMDIRIDVSVTGPRFTPNRIDTQFHSPSHTYNQ